MKLLKVVLLFSFQLSSNCFEILSSRLSIVRDFEFSAKISLKKFHTPLIISSVIINLLFPLPSYAKIPYYDEYNVGSGAVIIDRNRKEPEEKFSIPKGQLNSIAELTKSFHPIVQNFPSLITTKKWQTLNEQSKALQKISKNLSSSLKNEQLEDLSFSLGQLADLSLSRSVIFFNSEDLKGISLLTEGGDGEEEEEAQKEAQILARTILSLIKDFSESL
jgi:hypothetical protein